MKTLGNIVWFLFGGFELALMWFFVGIIMFISIIGIPWGKACFVLGNLAFWPFGRQAVSKNDGSIGSGPLGIIGNIIWFVLGGLWLALGHALAGVFLCITIVGIPFGLQHFKLAGLSFAPIGKTIVPIHQ